MVPTFSCGSAAIIPDSLWLSRVSLMSEVDARSVRGDSSNPADHLAYAFSRSRPFAVRDGVPVEDSEAFADACVGLCQAARRFDPERGFKFITFAGTCIRMSQIKGYHDRGRGWRNSEKSIGVDSVAGDSLLSVMDRSVAADDQVDHLEQLESLRSAIGRLPADLQQVVRSRMDGLLLREVAEQMNRSKQRVGQMEQKAHAMLREMLE